MASKTNTIRPHSAPGLYFSETVQTYSAKSNGITTLGVSGETLRGPAFQPISISNWNEYQTYFGGTSTEKFKGSQYPKYELPYIAKTYLEQSDQLQVVRVLGLSGVNAGPAWAITATKHKLFTGYDYVQIATEPAGIEWQAGINSFDNPEDKPVPPYINQTDPDNIRVLDHKEWHTVCNECPEIPTECQFDLTNPDKNQIPDANDKDCETNPACNCDTISVIQSYSYNSIENCTNISDVVYTYERISDPTPEQISVAELTSYISGTSPDPTCGDPVYASDKTTDPSNPVYYRLNCTSDPLSEVTIEKKDTYPTSVDYDSSDYIYMEEYNSTDEKYYYTYYEKTSVKYCYNKVSKYNYYQKTWKTNIQLAEEDTCEGNRNNMVIAVLRSRGEHKKAAFVRTPTESDIENGICDDIYTYDGIEYFAKSVSLEPSKSLTLGSSCNPGFSATTGDFTVDSYNYGTFTIKVTTIDGEEKRYSVSLNPSQKNYIYNVIGGNPEEGDAEIYVEELYDVALRQLINEGVFNAINSEVIEYPMVNIVPKFADVNDLLVDSALNRSYVGKRYLYSTELSAGIPVKYSEDNGSTWVDGEGENGMIYTVFERINPVTGKKEFFYGAYVNAINYEYEKLDEEPSGVEWIECSQTVTDEQQNAFETKGACSYFDTPTTDSPLYLRIGTGEPYDYYKKIIESLTPSTNKNKPTEQLQPYSFCNDVVDGRFTNCVRVASDDMIYVNKASNEAVEDVFPVTLDFNNYKEQYRYSSTPWIVSEIKGSAEEITLNKLFRFHTISDGNSSSTEIKVSIENIDPSTGKFDVLVRNFNDTDLNTNILERFLSCSLVPGSSDYIAYKIGSFDESYNAVSNYITVEVIEYAIAKNSIPAGFLGYPMRNYNGFAIKSTNAQYVQISETPEEAKAMDKIPDCIDETSPLYIKISDGNGGYTYYELKALTSTEPKQPYFRFNTTIDDEIKPKKQYFGVSDLVGIDTDVFKYKGVEAYNGVPAGLTPCFHLDSRIFNGTPDKDGYIFNGELKQIVNVDGLNGYSWVTVDKTQITSDGIEPRIGSEEVMVGTIYEDKKLRKFTVAFYGGWDGWDYYRTSRSIGDEYRYKDYKGNIDKTSGYGDMFNVIKNPEALNLEPTTKAINSDYYAYLAGARQFANPQDAEINLLATPGIDYVNNGQLVNEVIDMVEEERADCVYVVTTPDKPFGASDSKDDMFAPEEAVANLEDSDIDSNHTTSYYPWVKYFDSDNSEYIYLPITRDVVASIALTDSQFYPWYSNAGYNRGLISGVAPKRKLKIGEQDTLYDGRLNYVISFAQEGDRIWGDKDLQIADNQLNRLSTRRLLLRIKKLLQNACIGLIFDPNDNNCAKAVRSAVTTVLESVKNNRGIFDYRVEIDDSASTRDQLGLGVKYFIKKTNMLEWISFEATLTPEGVQW